jgi:hypothetical protein
MNLDPFLTFCIAFAAFTGAVFFGLPVGAWWASRGEVKRTQSFRNETLARAQKRHGIQKRKRKGEQYS